MTSGRVVFGRKSLSTCRTYEYILVHRDTAGKNKVAQPGFAETGKT